ncbi:MAG: isoleucine--tRNA ligase, partial [Nitrososphaerota archaeon]
EANTYIVIWTTTPWTLPGNESVAVNPDSRYLVLETGGERWIVAEPTLQRFTSETGLPSYRVVEVRDGAQLVGLTYRHPLEDEVPYHKGHTHRVIAWHHVSMEEGTGCVHIAPAHGPDDFELAQENSLPVFCPVSASGIFTSEGGRYEGLSVDEASRMVLEDLKVKGLLVKSGEILHSYPLCWRCGTKLIYLASVQWFLKVDRIKNAMVEGNKNVKWWPEWAGRNRFGEWLANADDWCISRTKVWGTPLPVWRCESCGNKRVVGSRKELEEAVEKPSNPDLHRPWIDQYIFKCGICGGPMRRLPFVLDTWLDSGVAHLASVNGLHDPQLFQRLFPYDFVTEAIDQTRGWFYTLLFTSTLLYGRPPYKSVLNQGHVLDEYGKKMSKSRGNVIWAVDAFERYGVDPLRIYLVYKAEPWSTINFVPSEIALVREQLNILWNIFSFASTYFSLDNYRPWEHSPRDYLDSLLPEDRWILTRVNTVVGQITRFLEEMEINKAAKTLLDFIVEDISRTYVRAIRRRAWSEKASREKLAAYTCLSYALRKTVQMLAPFAPYLAEALYIRVRGPQEPESIHLSDWPSLDSDLTWPDVEKHMEVVREALTAILAARQRAGRKLRTPVQRIIISPKTSEALKALKYFEDYLMASSNCRKLQIMDIGGVPDGVRWELQPNLKVLGPKLGRRLPLLQEKLKMLDAREVLSQLRTGNVYIKLDDGSEVTLQPDDLTVKELIPPNFSTGECSSCKVYVDTELPTELGAVAAANEVIRRIQLMRKEADLNVLDRIECVVKVGDRDFARSLITQMEYIEEETRSRLEVVIEDLEAGEGFHWRSWKIDGVDTLIGIRKV